MRRTLLAVLIVLAGCGSTDTSSTSTPKPSGVDQAVWDSYCVNAGHIVGTLQAIEKGTLTNAEAADRLGSNESDLDSDASAVGSQNADAGTKVQAVADAVGRMKVAVSSGQPADAAEVAAASAALPSCS